MKYIRVGISIILLLVLFAFRAHAQKTAVSDSMKMIVDLKYKPVLPDAFKQNDLPAIIETAPPVPSMNYNIMQKVIAPHFDVDPIRPAQMVGEPLQKLYRSELKAGFGNYSTAYGEYWLNDLRSKELTWGTHLKHLSSSPISNTAGYSYSGFSDNQIDLYGKKFLAHHTLYGDVDYSRNVIHWYGFDPSNYSNVDVDATKQRYSLISAKAGLISHFKDTAFVNYHTTLNYYNLSDWYDMSENNFKLDGKFEKYHDQELFRLNAGVDYYNRKTSVDTTNNAILLVNPSVIAKGDHWKADIGVTGVGDINDVVSKFHFYPSINAQFNVVDNIIIPYAGFNGKLQKASHKSLSDVNPFVSSKIVLINTDYKYQVHGGVRGSLSANTSYDARATFSQVKNMPFFVEDTTFLYKNKYGVVYDDVTLLEIHGELAYQQSEKLRLIAKGDYNSFTMTKEKQPWHTPAFKVSAAVNYNLGDKIIAKFDLFVMGKQFAKVGGTNPVKEIKSYADVNLGLEYRYTKLLSAFVNLNNMAAMRYARWDNYPTQRFNFMMGLSYSF